MYVCTHKQSQYVLNDVKTDETEKLLSAIKINKMEVSMCAYNSN